MDEIEVTEGMRREGVNALYRSQMKYPSAKVCVESVYRAMAAAAPAREAASIDREREIAERIARYLAPLGTDATPLQLLLLAFAAEIRRGVR